MSEHTYYWPTVHVYVCMWSHPLPPQLYNSRTGGQSSRMSVHGVKHPLHMYTGPEVPGSVPPQWPHTAVGGTKIIFSPPGSYHCLLPTHESAGRIPSPAPNPQAAGQLPQPAPTATARRENTSTVARSHRYSPPGRYVARSHRHSPPGRYRRPLPPPQPAEKTLCDYPRYSD